MDLRPECEALSEMLLNLAEEEGKLSVNNVHGDPYSGNFITY